MKEESHDIYHDETGIADFGVDTDNDSDGDITISNNSVILNQGILN